MSYHQKKQKIIKRQIQILFAVTLLIAVLLSIGGLGLYDIAFAAPSDVNDYMVQDVCVTSSGTVLSDDPYACPAGSTRRDLQVGEELPYHKFSQAAYADDVQISNSFPLKLGSGQLRYVHTLEFAKHPIDPSSWEAPAEFNYDVTLSGTFYPSYDGYNIDEADGTYAAISGTRDPVGGIQPFWAPGCTFNDAWLLFPTDTINLVWGSAIAQVRIAQTCPTQFDSALTLWDKYTSYTYASGKNMSTVTSWHYGAATVTDASHIEKFFYTREYGLTRWERWERQANGSPLPRSFGCNGIDSHDGFVRRDCRDWSTDIRPDPVSGYSPYNIPIDSRFVPNNLLVNGDLGDGTFIENQPWSRIHYSSTMNWALIIDDPNSSDVWARNHHLAMSCANCLGNAVYQDVQRDTVIVPNNSILKFGGTVWSDGAGQIQITLFLRDANGVIKQRQDLILNTHTGKQKFSGQITLTDATVSNFRYTLYPITNNRIFRVDNLWLARTP